MTGPYGPATSAVRQFLVRLAGLGASARAEAVQRFEEIARTSAFVAAELRLAETIERSGRTDARDALAGPLLQLVRIPDAPDRDTPVVTPDDDEGEADALAQLDPIAEPALAALLALLVADLLPQSTTDQLYAPFAELIPRPDVSSST